MNEIENYLYP